MDRLYYVLGFVGLGFALVGGVALLFVESLAGIIGIGAATWLVGWFGFEMFTLWQDIVFFRSRRGERVEHQHK